MKGTVSSNFHLDAQAKAEKQTTFPIGISSEYQILRTPLSGHAGVLLDVLDKKKLN